MTENILPLPPACCVWDKLISRHLSLLTCRAWHNRIYLIGSRGSGGNNAMNAYVWCLPRLSAGETCVFFLPALQSTIALIHRSRVAKEREQGQKFSSSERAVLFLSLARNANIHDSSLRPRDKREPGALRRASKAAKWPRAATGVCCCGRTLWMGESCSRCTDGAWEQ